MALDGRGAPPAGGVIGDGGRVTGLRAPSGDASDATRAEEAIDEILAESFPASDAPPWTLGVEPHSVYVAVRDGPPEGSAYAPIRNR